MMNNLNSILIEGVVCEDAVYSTDADGVECGAFSIDSTRFFVSGGGKKATSEVTNVSVCVRTKSLVEALERHAKEGRGVRVVGRLASNKDGLYIEAEHVEFRPEPKRAGKKAE